MWMVHKDKQIEGNKLIEKIDSTKKCSFLGGIHNQEAILQWHSVVSSLLAQNSVVERS